MSFTVRVKIPVSLQQAPERLQQGVKSGLERSVGIVTNAAIQKAPRKTGNLKRSIQAEPVQSSVGLFLGRTVQNKTVAKYGAFVEFGTGIYGPNHTPIVPKTAPFLVWKDARGWHRVRSVRGMRARPYMRPAVEENVKRIESVIQEEIDNQLKKG